MMKRCTSCGVDKPVTEFSFRRSAVDGRASWCRDCFKVNWRKRYYGNHDAYKKRHSASQKRLRRDKARRVYEYLKQHPCVDCGEADPVVLEFDHKGDAIKLESVTQMIVSNASWENIFEEIRKCDVRCANCHRRRTAAQFGYKRFVFSGDENYS